MKNIYYVKLNEGFSRFELNNNFSEGDEKEIIPEDKLHESIESFLETSSPDNIVNIYVDPSYDAPDDIKEIQAKTDVPNLSYMNSLCYFIREMRSAIPLVFRHDSEIVLRIIGDQSTILVRVYEPEFYITNEYGEKYLTHDWIHYLEFKCKKKVYRLYDFRSKRLSQTWLNQLFQHSHQTASVGSMSGYCTGSSALALKLGSGVFEPVDEFNIIMDLKSVSEFVRQESISGIPHRSSRIHLKFGSLVFQSTLSEKNTYEIYEKNKEMIINESLISINQTGTSVSFKPQVAKLFAAKVNHEGKVIADKEDLYRQCAEFTGSNSNSAQILGREIKGRKVPLTKEEVDECVDSYFNKEFKQASEFIIKLINNNVKNVLSKTKLSEVYFQD